MLELGKTCVDYKLKHVKNLKEISYDSAYRIRRYADRKYDAWTMVNRLQENLIKGGIKYTYEKEVTEEDRFGEKTVLGHETNRQTTSQVRSIPQNVALNRMVFDKALEILG